MRASALVVATSLLLGGAGVSGCGSETSADAARDPTSPAATSAAAEESASVDPDAELPSCSEVWQEGARLPTGYRGCAEEGAAVKPGRIRCSFGLVIVTHADRFYAVPGDRISEVDSLVGDPDFERTVTSCQA